MAAVWLVIMGVAGCGKSSLGRDCAHALQLPFLEGDDFHPAANIEKMRQGTPLTDADRAEWLDKLAQQLRLHTGGVVLACSALKARFRATLRAAQPELKFVYLDISRAQATERVLARRSHFFPVTLLGSQFDALEPPNAEPGVLCLGAENPREHLLAQSVSFVR
jgi:gluconokinase